MKLTIEQALAIRRSYETKGPGGQGMRALAARYGVSMSMIHDILTGIHPLVRGTPNISGNRGRLLGGHSDAVRELTPRQRSVTDRPTHKPLEQIEREARRRACPVCGARNGEYCTTTRPGAAYARDMKHVHPERREQG